MKHLKHFLPCFALALGVFVYSGVTAQAEEGTPGDTTTEGIPGTSQTDTGTGNTGDVSGNTGDTSGNTGDTSGNTGDTSGNTGDTSGNTGDTSGNTGDTSGNTGDTSGNTGDTSGNTNLEDDGDDTDTAGSFGEELSGNTNTSGTQGAGTNKPAQKKADLAPSQNITLFTEAQALSANLLAAPPYTGERYENGKWYYYQNGVRTTGWRSLSDGRLVYYNTDGSMHFGERRMQDGKWYYFSPNNGAWTGGWQNFDGRNLYYNWERGMFLGEGFVDGAWRYFNKGFGTLTHGMVKLDDGRNVAYNQNGMIFGEGYVNGQWRYFDLQKNGNMAKGWQNLPDGRLVYYNTDGGMFFGERKMQDGKWYYFNPNNGGAWTGGLTNLPDGRVVYYNWERGMHFGTQIIGGSPYTFRESDGHLLSGWQRAADGTLYLIPATYIWPSDTSTRITSYFGYRTHPITGKQDFHLGVDIGAGHGTNVLAAASGMVTVSTWHYSYGNYIIVDHGGGRRTLYAHMSQLLVGAGQQVAQGVVIGLVGATGQVTGAHIHFETFTSAGRVDPLSYF